MKTPVHFLRQRVFHPALASLITVGLMAVTIPPAPVHAGLVPEPSPVAVPTNFFPPRDNAFGQLRNVPPLAFAGLPPMLRNLQHVGFEDNAPLVETPGAAQVLELPHTATFELSTDGGQTWKKGSALAKGTVRVAVGDVNGDGVYDTEMLALDISGGSLPVGVRLRESPTRASTGRIKVRFPTLPGEPESHWLRMSSFFDVWTELSLDDGQTWAAATQPESIVLDPGQRRDFHPSNFQPLDAALRKVDDDTIDFVGDAAIGRYVLRAGIPLNREPPPPAGQTRQITIVQEIFCDLSLDGGLTFMPVSAPAGVRVAVGDLNGDGVYETEMLQMDVAGGSLPPGVMIRESPTLASLGRMTIESVDGGFRIGSFFDVFTENSLDGGQTWSPATDVVRLQHRVESPQPIVHNATVFPWRESVQGTHDGELGAQTAGGLRVTNFEMTAAGDGMPLPAAGAATTVGVPHRFVWDTRQDSGPIIKGSALGTVTIRITPRDSFGNIRTFDTEMLALELTGATPGGLMIRESPTRASLGIIEVSDSSTGSDQRIGSFFDVFTEISLDGGQTWQQTDGPFRVALLPAIQKVRSASRTMPRTGTLSVSAGDTGHKHAGQGGAGAGKISMRDFHFVMSVPSALPEPGAIAIADFNGDGRLDLVLPDGSSASGVGALAGRVFIHHDSDNDGISYFDTEMLELSISGGSLPSGIMLRESPTLRSTGRTTLTIIAGGDFRIDSFFDVFTEISLDGGATWRQSDGPLRVDMTHFERLIVTGPGEQAPPQVRGFSGPGATPILDFLAYADAMVGSVRVAVGDVNGDKTEDIIVAPGSGAAPHVKVFDGATLGELRSFFAYDAAFTGGVYVAAGDVNGDGFDDIIVAPGSGAAPHVKVFDGRTGGELASFFAYGAAFSGGVRVAAGDVNGDGFADIITGAGAGAGPHVKVFDGRTGAVIRSFFAFSAGFTGGVFVAAGDLNGDGRADIIVGADAGAGPHVKVFDGQTSAELASFFAYGAGYSGGVRVASGDVDGDGRADIITGAGGAGPHVKAFSGVTLGEIASFYAYPATFCDSVYVGAKPPPTSILPPADLDGDGLLDVWEHAYFGSITAHDADDDSDGDGLSELEELGFGLNPKIPDRARAPAVTVEDGYLTLTLMKQLGAAYEVQSGGRLGLGGPDTFSSDSTTILINDATTLKVRDNIRIGAEPMRFLRAKVLGAP